MDVEVSECMCDRSAPALMFGYIELITRRSVANSSSFVLINVGVSGCPM